MAATNIVEYTNPITNIKYTFEFTNKNSSGPDPWVYIDTSVNVLQEDNAGQSYEISVKLVWNNSLLPGQQPVMVQVRCTRDSTAMSSAVSQNGWMSDSTGGCNSTSAHYHTWYDRRNGPSIWNQDAQMQLAYKGVQTTGWVFVGNEMFWPTGDNNYFARLLEKFCHGGHSPFDTTFYLKSDPSASNTGAPSPPPPAVITSSTILCNDSGGYNDSGIMGSFTITNISGPTSNRTTVVTFKQGLPNNSGAYQINSYADFLSFCTAASIPLNTDITVHNSQPALSDAPCFRGMSGSVTDQSGLRTFNIGPASITVTGGSTFRNVGDDVTLYITRIFLSDASGNCGGGGSSSPSASAIGGSHPGITPSGGTGSSPRGSGIAYEYIEYSQNPANPTFNSITPTQTISFPLSDPPRIPSALNLDVTDTNNNNTSWNLHYAVKDKADNESISVTYPFKIDNEKPININVNINNGFNKSIDNEIMVYCDTYDEDSGVIQYYISEILGGVEDTSTRLHTTLSPVISPAHTIDRIFVFNSTPGQRTIRIKTMDQADNYQISDFDVEVSSQRAVWHNFTATRNPVTAFSVNIEIDVEIVADNPDLLSQYYFTFDRLDFPSSSDFIDLRNNMDTSHWIDSLDMVENTLTKTHLYVFVKTANGFFSKREVEIDNSNSTSLGSVTSIDIADGEIEINSPIKRTSNQTNNYRLRAKGNTIYYQHATQPNADLITGYTIRDTGIAPSTPPAYNSATLMHEDNAGEGWELIDPTKNEYTNANKDFTFSTTTNETKAVTLYASTVGGAIISAVENVEYESDQEGPKANSVTVDSESCPVDSGVVPNQRFKKPTTANTTPLTVDIELYDVSDVYRWIFLPNPIVGYRNLTFDQTTHWNIEASPTQTLNLPTQTIFFGYSTTSTYFVYAMDALENVSENRIQIEYISDADAAAMGGGMTAANNVITKFEGKPHEHITRNTITSMFGGGTFHEEFISLRHNEDLSGHEAKSIIDSRTHKLSEYSGLNVYDKANNINTTLPDVGDAIKFSNFKDKRPVIDSQHISVYTTNKTIEDIPTKIGDSRKFCVLMNIDTGRHNVQHMPVENQNLIDIDATWEVNFIPAFDQNQNIRLYYGPTNYSPDPTNFSATDHGVLSCNFTQEGIYVIKGLTSFGDVLIGTYYISNAVTTSSIPTSGSEVGPIPSNGTFTVDYDVSQLSLGVDAVFAFDASVSYANGSPSFLTAAESAFPVVLDRIDDFSNDGAGNSSSRYAVVEFGTFTEGPYMPWVSSATNETTLVSNFGAIGNQSAAKTALANINLNGRVLGGIEAQWHVVKQIADQSVNPGLGDWRTTALKMILLFSDTSPDWPKLADVAAREQIKDDCVDALNNKEIYFVLFDGKQGINGAFHNQGIKFNSIIPLKAESGDAEIEAAMTQLFNDYQTATSYDLRPHIPGIFKSCVPSTSQHPSGTPMPIPYTNNVGGRVYFDVELDEDVVNNFIGPSSLIPAGTTIQIQTYIVTYNSTNNPIRQQKLKISHTF